MAYQERIKNFEHIRSYMRDFYVYGFKTRDEFREKSGRSYDNEKRRIESYLGDYIRFRQTSSGKNVFLSIDSRNTIHNPFYKVWKAKSFTDGDITLHFIVLDILFEPKVWYTVKDLLNKIYQEYLNCFEAPINFDESTLRKKLKEYVSLGILVSRQEGKAVIYSRADSIDIMPFSDILEFYSEVGLCGVIGSFLLDQRVEKSPASCFSFKHHYITHTLDSEELYLMLQAISDKREVTFSYTTQRNKRNIKYTIIPLKIYISVQSGRHYIMGYDKRIRSIKSYRLDYISQIEIGKEAEKFNIWREKLEEKSKHIWGVVCGKEECLEHIEFTIYIREEEEYVYRRMEREKRCGIVERLDKNTCRFLADIYDTWEAVPWIRTFLGRITSMNFSNRTVENYFKEDIQKMYQLYQID